MSLKTYAVYTRCERCGVYDRDPGWCDLCGKPKDPAAGTNGRPAVEPPPPVVRRARPKPAPKKKRRAAAPKKKSRRAKPTARRRKHR